jgi:soluble P-type ATPase
MKCNFNNNILKISYFHNILLNEKIQKIKETICTAGKSYQIVTDTILNWEILEKG